MERCDELLDSPITREEWVDADLIQMDGREATDEELVAYWATFRRGMELDMSEPPELYQVADALRAGKDPVAEFESMLTRDD